MRPPEPNDSAAGLGGPPLPSKDQDCDDLSSPLSNEGFQGESSSCEKVVFVKTKKVGYLIGHHGRTILGFENFSGGKIDIMTPNSRADETPIKVSGTKESVSKAISMMMDLFSLNNYSSKPWLQIHSNDLGRGSPINKSPQEHIGNEEVTVPTSLVTLGLFSKENIDSLEHMFGSKIIFQPTFPDDQELIMTVNVVGTAENNIKTVKALGCLLDRAASIASIVASSGAEAAAAYAFPTANLAPVTSPCIEFDANRICIVANNLYRHPEQRPLKEDNIASTRSHTGKKSNLKLWRRAVVNYGLPSY